MLTTRHDVRIIPVSRQNTEAVQIKHDPLPKVIGDCQGSHHIVCQNQYIIAVVIHAVECPRNVTEFLSWNVLTTLRHYMTPCVMPVSAQESTMAGYKTISTLATVAIVCLRIGVQTRCQATPTAIAAIAAPQLSVTAVTAIAPPEFSRRDLQAPIIHIPRDNGVTAIATQTAMIRVVTTSTTIAAPNNSVVFDYTKTMESMTTITGQSITAAKIITAVGATRHAAITTRNNDIGININVTRIRLIPFIPFSVLNSAATMNATNIQAGTF